MNFGTRLYSALEGVVIAIDSIRSNKVRAGLTILGIAVGVFVVVVISACVHGINAGVARDFEKAGPMTFFLSRYPITFEACDGTDDTCLWRHNPPITMTEWKSIEELPTVKAAGARLFIGPQAKYKDRTLASAQVIGFSSNWTQVDGGSDLYPGRTWTQAEAAGAQRVIIINDEMAKQLFQDSDPIDKILTLNNQPFQVIGVFHYAASFLSGGNRPRAYIPIETAIRRLKAFQGQLGLAIVPRAEAGRDATIDEVIEALRGRRRLHPGTTNNFAIITQDQLFDTYNKIFGAFFLVMISLSAVGLIVGGVGVVAIMMISVTERTREIGVRKALGATRGTIMWQFLVEAVTLTGIGAIVGLIVGGAASLILRSATPIEASIPPLSIVAALAASAFTGILFGLLPAAKASKLNPVDALRYE
ncbi:MAG TPA: ABC transporter permease [Gemmatimonadaceae bacterium]